MGDPDIPCSTIAMPSNEDRVTRQKALLSTGYEGLRLPVTVILDNIRSMYNVGAFFRAADGAGLEKLCLAGITAQPPKNAITKTALGAENFVPWEHNWEAIPMAERMHAEGYEIAAIETSSNSVDLFAWQPRFPVCVLFGNEIDGLQPKLREMADTHVRIPMLGQKTSLNVATAAGIVLYELLRKYHVTTMKAG
ncbi:MAG TPA: TrmH family RNA methyltransferase [Terriglobales bacterium]|nr:TrmH family RNA methyltransferase [Terriglobales bacterium]